MPESLNWDEFRIVRAIAETRTLAGAAERLGFNHSTMFRRLSAVEARLGLRLFDRGRGDYRPTAAGEDMVSLAVLMGDTIAEFEHRVARNDVPINGLVRLTTLYSLGLMVVPEAIAALRAAHSGLHVEVILTEASLDLHRGEADIAVRCLKQPPQSGLTGNRIAALPWAIYALRAHIDDTGELRRDAPWIMPAENFGPPQARDWFQRHVEPWRRAATASNDLFMADLAARGVGAALLPSYAAMGRPDLIRVGAPDMDLDCDLWLIASTHALRAPRVRAAFDLLSASLTQRRQWLEGGRPADV